MTNFRNEEHALKYIAL